MPKPIATQEAVFKAADTLAATGEEPSIIRVQETIGAGSYTTIKRFLDAWKIARASERALPIEIPTEIAARGTEFVQALWQAAMALTEQRISQIRAEHERQVTETQARLSEAEQTIERLEVEAAERERTIEVQIEVGKQHEQELSILHAAQAADRARIEELVRRTDDLQHQLTERTDELRTAGQRLETTLVERARLEGELEALRRQLNDQQMLLQQLGRGGAT